MLDVKTKRKLNELIVSYDSLKNLENTNDYFFDVINIVNQDKLFNNVIKPCNKEYFIKNLATSMKFDLCKNINIYLNAEGEKEYILNHIKNVFKNLNYKYYYSYRINNIFYLMGILHECAHVNQILYKNNFNENKILNELYSDIFNNKNLDFYNIYPLAFSYERNANLFSSSEVYEILNLNKDKYFMNFPAYIYLYESGLIKELVYPNGYEIRDNKIISPVERTYNLKFNKKEVPYYNFFTKDLFEHGLPIKSDEYEEILKAYNSELTYISAYKNIQECFKKIDNKKTLLKK